MSKVRRGWGLAIMAISVLTATTTFGAQDGPTGRWWRNSQIVAQLELSDGEIQQLEKAFESLYLPGMMANMGSTVRALMIR